MVRHFETDVKNGELAYLKRKGWTDYELSLLYGVSEEDIGSSTIDISSDEDEE